MGDRGTFEELLQQYKSNYVQWISTGNDAYKTAYENAQDSIEKLVSAKQDSVESQKEDMNHFVNSYKDGNDEMSEEYDKAAGLYSTAQQIEDDYQAAKNRYDLYTEDSVKNNIPSVDVTTGYSMVLRIGIILVILPILFLVGFWSPSMNFITNPFGISGPSAVAGPSGFMSPGSPFMSPVSYRGWM
jgi:uncharacterized membrane protein YkgB